MKMYKYIDTIQLYCPMKSKSDNGTMPIFAGMLWDIKRWNNFFNQNQWMMDQKKGKT